MPDNIETFKTAHNEDFNVWQKQRSEKMDLQPDKIAGESQKRIMLGGIKVKIAILSICLTVFVALSSQSGAAPTNQWNTFVLWSNQVLSASLMYLPEPSLADEDFMFVEFDNHTDKPLDVARASLSLPATKTDRQTQQSWFLGDLVMGIFNFGKLPPGKTRADFQPRYALDMALANLGLPPKHGFHVEITPKAEFRLTDGTTLSTSDANRKFSFEFRYPDPAEMESIKARFKALLAHPDHQFASAYYLQAISRVPEVGDSATRDELLASLKSLTWVDGKEGIMAIVGRRFPNDPGMLAYFVDQLSHDDGDAFFSFPHEVWQNPIFIEPLVKRYEKHGNDSTELLQLRPVWVTNEAVVARLSVALLQRHPVLNRNVGELTGTNLCDWETAVSQAGIIGNTNFLKWLEPALDDKRTIPDCLSKYDSRPRPAWNARVCDCAVEAILMIVDGDSSSAFKKAGITGWRTEEEDYAAHEQIIADLKRRLNLTNDGRAK